MKSARNQFILIGFLSQGLAWESPLYWIFAPLLWIAALSPFARRLKTTQTFEFTALVGGSALAYLFGKVIGQSSHFFLGDGVVMLQAARLMRPLSRREKLASVLMACFHVAVACTLAPDIRFLFLALAALILLPKSLVELQSEDFDRDDSRLEWTVLIPLTLVAIAIFISVPRFSLGNPIHLGAAPSQGGLLSSVLDPSSGGYANSAQVLLQIEGTDLRYIKCMALSQFDGQKWRVDETVALRPFRRVPDDKLESYLHRRVHVKNIQFLGRILPTDGVPVALRGKFFTKPLLNTQGAIECATTWNSANNKYEYWIDRNPLVENLTPQMIRAYTDNPGASPRLNDWLRQVTQGATNQYEVARRLEAHLRRNFEYRIGAPALNRLNSLEHFLFEKREGHCERFASALALLLRMHNIPTRIAIGYVPGPVSRFSDWRQVRFKDAHSWTEAWFPDKGWVTLDATPGGGADEGYGFTQFIEGVDLFWYSNVISFDGATQKEIVQQLMTGMMAIPGLAQRNLGLFFSILGLGFVPLILRKARGLGAGKKVSPNKYVQITDAEHFYAELTRILARRGIQRTPEQTPLEFLKVLRAQNTPHMDKIEEITRAFCVSHYGEQSLPSEQIERISGHLRSISTSKDFSTKTLA